MRPFIMFRANSTSFSDDSTNGYRVITPSSAEYSCGLNDPGSIHIEHPIDSEGKWRTIVNGEIILAPIYRRGEEFPQPFRIYRITKSRKNGVPTISADALHVFYDLNYVIFGPKGQISGTVDLQSWLDNLALSTLQPLGFWHSSGFEPNPEYWNPPIDRFQFVTNITSQHSYTASSTVSNHIVGSADSIVAITGGELLCDGFVVNICKKRTFTKANAFNIAYGLNLEGITQTIDDSNVLTLLYPTSNLDGMDGAVYPTGYDLPGEKFADMGYPFSRVGSVEFNYQVEEGQGITSLWNKYLKTDAPGYFTRRKTPTVTYAADLSVRQISDGIANIATYEPGDTGLISDPDLGISTQQTIVKKTVDLIKQRVKSVELSNDEKKPFTCSWGGIVSSGQSSLEKRVKSQ